jgi:hypothetical protein
MSLKRIVAGAGLAGAITAGVLGATAGTALAAYNDFIHTVYSDSAANAASHCQEEADYNNNNWTNYRHSWDDYFYCAPGPSDGTNLWVRRP